MLPAQPNQSLIDGLACLQYLAAAGRPLGSREIAAHLGLEPTRANRLLKTLAALGIAQQNAARQYVPGPGMLVLAAQATFGSGLMRRAVEPLQELRRFKLNVAMGVLWQRNVSYLYNARPQMRPGEAIGRTGLFPATRSSIGMILLAHLPDDDVRALYRGHEIPGFPQGAETLLAALAEIRALPEPYALIRPSPTDERERSLAVAISGEPAAIALSGHLDLLQRDELIEALREVAGQITASPKP